VAAPISLPSTAWVPRLFLVLPVLAAVFLMHGVQCGGDDHAAEHTVLAMGAHPAGAVDHTSADAGTAQRLDSGPGSPSPLSPDGVCLMLLTGGLTVLLALLGLRRWSHRVEGADPPLRTRAFVAGARPPSLAQLCLLRI
jgi:hypothetical protein